MPPNDPVLAMPAECHKGIFLERVKRFSVRIRYGEQEIWAHTNNTGAMRGVLYPNAPVLFSTSSSPHRKLPFTLEAVWKGFWIGVNTQTPNRFLEKMFEQGQLPFAAGYKHIQREARYGQSRIDARFSGAAQPDSDPAANFPDLWVECKNVTLTENGVALFPDAPSSRARKHLNELAAIRRAGHRAAMFFLVQRPDCACVAPARKIDPAYAELFSQVVAQGVECYACVATVQPRGIAAGQWLPVRTN